MLLVSFRVLNVNRFRISGLRHGAHNADSLRNPAAYKRNPFDEHDLPRQCHRRRSSANHDDSRERCSVPLFVPARPVSRRSAVASQWTPGSGTVQQRRLPPHRALTASRIMGSTLDPSFRLAKPTPVGVRQDGTRRATAAELEYVRARAREAARADFEAEQRRSEAADEVPPCE